MVKIKVCILNSEHNIAIKFKSVCVCLGRVANCLPGGGLFLNISTPLKFCLSVPWENLHRHADTHSEKEKEPHCQQDLKGKTGDIPTVYAHSGNSTIFNP